MLAVFTPFTGSDWMYTEQCKRTLPGLPQVPPEALLDIDLPDEEQQQQQQDGSSGPQAAPASVQGEIGFLSHEPVVAGTASRRARQPGEECDV